MPAISQQSSWKKWVILLALCGLAFALRSHNLDGRSLWIDEGISLNQASQPILTLLQSDPIIYADGMTAPASTLYTIALAVIQSIGGGSVFSLRLISVWGGVLSIPLLFLLGQRLFGRSAGLITAFLGTVSPYQIWHAQAALPESLFLSMAMLSVLTLHRLVTSRSSSWHRAVFWLVTSLAMLYSHRAGIWVLGFSLAVVGVTVLMRRERRGLLAWAMALFLLSLPQVSQLPEGPTFPVGHRPSWYEARQLIDDEDLAQAVVPSPGEPKGSSITEAVLPILRLLPAGSLVLASFIWLIAYPRRTQSWLFTGGLLLIPPALASLTERLALYAPGSHYALAAIPASLLLEGAGASALWRRRRSLAVAGVLGAIAVMGHWTFIQFSSPSFAREDVKATAEYISEGAREGDVVVLHDASTLFVWDHYYRGAAPVEVIPHYEDSSWMDALGRFQEIGQTHERVWLVHRPLQPCVLDPDPLIQYGDSQWVKFEAIDFSSPWLDIAVDAYMTAPPVVDSVPPDATPIALCWPEGLCLHGWSAENLVLGAEASITLYWSQDHPTSDDYLVDVAFQDSHGQHWSEGTDLIFPYYPASRWPTGSILKQEQSIQLSPALPPTSFSLAALVRRVSDGRLMAADTGQGINLIGQITLERPAETIDPNTLSLQYKSDAEFDDTVRLLGYSLPIDTPRPGHTSFIDFFWQTIAAPPDGWQQQTRLMRNGTIWVEKVGPLSLAEFDPVQWLPGDLVWGRIFLPLPGQMPPGEYAVEVALLDPAGDPVPAKEFWRAEAVDSVTAGPAYLESWPMLTTPPAMPHRPDIIIGGAIRLWGHKLERTVQIGEALDVTLVWRDELPVDEDYRVFVHLMDENDELLGQADGVPAGWTRPTSTWRPGEFIVDHYSIPITADMAPGVGYLWVGLYHPSGSGRLPVSNSADEQETDRTLLDIVVIEP